MNQKSKAILQNFSLLCSFLILTELVSARSISALHFRAPQGAPEKIFIYGEDVKIELPLPRMHLVVPVKLKSKETTFKITIRPVTKESPLPLSAPSVKIPLEWTEVILLFSNNPEDPVFPFFVTAINVSDSKFKPGELMIFNRSSVTVGGQIGAHRMKVAAGKTVKIQPPARKRGDYRVMIGYQPAGHPKVRPLCDTTWRHEPTMRQLLFILPDAQRRVPRIWSVRMLRSS